MLTPYAMEQLLRFTGFRTVFLEHIASVPAGLRRDVGLFAGAARSQPRVRRQHDVFIETCRIAVINAKTQTKLIKRC